MKDFATKYLDMYKGFSKWVKVILCLLWDVPSNLYRFSKSALKDSYVGMIIAVLLAIFGGWVLFLIDALTLALQEKIYWIDDLGLEDAGKADSSDATTAEDAEKKDEE